MMQTGQKGTRKYKEEVRESVKPKVCERDQTTWSRRRMRPGQMNEEDLNKEMRSRMEMIRTRRRRRRK